MVAPDKLTLKGTIRDFKSYVTPTGEINPGGHIDFENVNLSEKGIVKADLGSDKKPVYAGGNNTPEQKTTHGKETFDQWYRDVLEVNQSIPYEITLDFDPTSRVYTFDSKDQTKGRNQDGLGGFFPIDSQGFGNEGRVHNYSFTYELHTQFTYQGYESFTYTGDDDLWVFIDNKLVIDLGGVHSAQKATVDLKAKKVIYYKEDLVTVDQELPLALDLTEQVKYDLDIFFAERHTHRSVFRIDTSLLLVPVPLATITASQPNADKIAQTPGEFTIALDFQPAEDITVLYEVTAASTAVAGEDYQTLTGLVTFSPTDPLAKTVAVIPGATRNENVSKTVMVALEPPAPDAPYKVDTAPAVVTIADRLAVIVPTATVTASQPNADKIAQTSGEFTITLNPPPPQAITVVYEVSPTSTAVAGQDYQPLSGAVIFGANEPSKTIAVVPGATLNENANKTVVVVLQSPASDPNAYKVGDPNWAGVTIADRFVEIPLPTSILFASKPTATKPKRGQPATDLGEFTIQLDRAAPRDIFINFSVGGNAREGTDYQRMDRRVFFSMGQAVATMPVIPLDTLGSPTSEVRCTLQPGDGYHCGNPTEGVVTIRVPGGPVIGP